MKVVPKSGTTKTVTKFFTVNSYGHESRGYLSPFAIKILGEAQIKKQTYETDSPYTENYSAFFLQFSTKSPWSPLLTLFFQKFFC